jgi:hypothetical protein
MRDTGAAVAVVARANTGGAGAYSVAKAGVSAPHGATGQVFSLAGRLL